MRNRINQTAGDLAKLILLAPIQNLVVMTTRGYYSSLYHQIYSTRSTYKTHYQVIHPQRSNTYLSLIIYVILNRNMHICGYPRFTYNMYDVLINANACMLCFYQLLWIYYYSHLLTISFNQLMYRCSFRILSTNGKYYFGSVQRYA